MERERIVASMKHAEFRRLDEKKVNEIKSKFTGPLIAVIGASSPGYEYAPQLGIVAGYELRKLCNNNGYLFSGGVEGVGADVFTGACIYATQNKFPSKFFVVIPDNYTIPGDQYDDDRVLPYELSEAYKAIERITESECEIVRAGYEMAERRLYLSAIADVVVAINGSSGTFDEAKLALEFGKTVIALQSSGGAAKALCQWKVGYKPKTSDKHNLRPFLATLSTKPSPEISEKIIIAKNVAEMIGILRNFIKPKM